MPKMFEEHKRRKILEHLRKEYPEKSDEELERMAGAIQYGPKKRGMKRGKE